MDTQCQEQIFIGNWEEVVCIQEMAKKKELRTIGNVQ